MKIEKICHTAPGGNESNLALTLLFKRMAGELCEMTDTCKNVEEALGAIIGTPDRPIDQPIIALQGLDRLRQSLEDLARLSSLLAQTKAFSADTISTQTVRDNIVLEGLAARLTRSENTLNKMVEIEQDVIWT